MEIFIDSAPDTPLKGKVTNVASISEFTPRNIQTLEERRHQVFGVKVVPENPDLFNSGMFAEVRFQPWKN